MSTETKKQLLNRKTNEKTCLYLVDLPLKGSKDSANVAKTSSILEAKNHTTRFAGFPKSKEPVKGHLSEGQGRLLSSLLQF